MAENAFQDTPGILGAWKIQDSDVHWCRRWAEVMVMANRKGPPMEVADSSNAATALAPGVPLMTRNAADYAGADGSIILSAP